MNNTAETAALRNAMKAATKDQPLFVATVRGAFVRIATAAETATWRAWQKENAKIDRADIQCGRAIDVSLIFDERHVRTDDGYSITRYTGEVVTPANEAVMWAFD